MSLNASFPLDDEMLFEEGYEPGEVPDLEPDLKLIAALEAQWQDLEYLRQDLIASSGMCQKLALEAERILPGFINPQKPLGYFTVVPTMTQYKVSMEAISSGWLAAIAAAVLALVVLIDKFITWLRNHKVTSTDTNTVKEFDERDHDKNSRLSKITDIAKNPEGVFNGDKRKVEQIISPTDPDTVKKNLIAEYLEALEASYMKLGDATGEYYEFASTNTKAQILINRSPRFVVFADKVIPFLGKYAQAMPVVLKSYADFFANIHDIKDDAEAERKAGSMRDTFLNTRRHLNNQMPTEILAEISEMLATTAPGELKYERGEIAKVAMAITGIFKAADIEHIRKSFDDGAVALTRVGTEAEAYERTVRDATDDHGLLTNNNTLKNNVYVRKMMSEFNAEVTALLQLLTIARGFIHTYVLLIKRINGLDRQYQIYAAQRTSGMAPEIKQELADYFNIGGSAVYVKLNKTN